MSSDGTESSLFFWVFYSPRSSSVAISIYATPEIYEKIVVKSTTTKIIYDFNVNAFATEIKKNTLISSLLESNSGLEAIVTLI